MPTMQVDAHELSKVKVEYISLVKRGANRLPIRILKGDTAVLDLDLHNQKQDRKRALKADAAQKTSQAISDATLLLVQAGYKVIAAAGGDGDERSDDGAAIDADPVTADDGKNPVGSVKNATGVAAVTGTTRLDDGSPNEFSPDSPELSIGKTGKIKNTTGVSDGATPADDGVGGTTLLYPTSPTLPVAKAEGKTKKVPASAAGVEAMVEPVAKTTKKPVAKAGPKTQPVTGTTVSDADDDDDGDAENPVTDDDDVTDDEANQEGVTVPSVAKSKTKKADDDSLAQLLAGMAAMNANVTALAASVQKMDGTVAGIKTEVDAVSARVAKTDKSLAALVPGQARNDHEVRVAKSDNKTYPLIDTGFKSRL